MYKVIQAVSILTGCVYAMDIESADDAALAKLLMGEATGADKIEHELRFLQSNATTAAATTATPTVTNPPCVYNGANGLPLVSLGNTVSATCCSAMTTILGAGAYSAGLAALIGTCPSPVAPPYFAGCVNENSTNTQVKLADGVTPVTVSASNIGKMPTDASYIGAGGVGCAYDQGCFDTAIGYMQANQAAGGLHAMFNPATPQGAGFVAKLNGLCMASATALPCAFGGPTAGLADFGNLTPKCCDAAVGLLKQTMNGANSLPTASQAEKDRARYSACEPSGCASGILTGLNAGSGTLKTTLQGAWDANSDSTLDTCVGFETTTAAPTTVAPTTVAATQAASSATSAVTEAASSATEAASSATEASSGSGSTATEAAGSGDNGSSATQASSGTEAASSATQASGNNTESTPAPTAIVRQAVAVTMQIALGANQTMSDFLASVDITVDTPAAVAFRGALVDGFRQSLGSDCPVATCTISIKSIVAARRALAGVLRALQSSGGIKVEYEIETTAAAANAIGTKLEDPAVLANVGTNTVSAIQADTTLSADPAFANFAVTGVTAEVTGVVEVTTAAPPAAPAATDAESSATKFFVSMSAFVLAFIAVA